MERIVVGVDGSPPAAAALRWALDEARRRRARLEVVHIWTFPAVGEVPGAAVDTLVDDLGQAGAEMIDQVVDDVAGPDPGVEIERRVIEGAPASAALVYAARGADLLVVGSRGRGGFKELLLGSVAQHCTHHARCPVVVVRAPSPAGRASAPRGGLRPDDVGLARGA